MSTSSTIPFLPEATIPLLVHDVFGGGKRKSRNSSTETAAAVSTTTKVDAAHALRQRIAQAEANLKENSSTIHEKKQSESNRTMTTTLPADFGTSSNPPRHPHQNDHRILPLHTNFFSSLSTHSSARSSLVSNSSSNLSHMTNYSECKNDEESSQRGVVWTPPLSQTPVEKRSPEKSSSGGGAGVEGRRIDMMRTVRWKEKQKEEEQAKEATPAFLQLPQAHLRLPERTTHVASVEQTEIPPESSQIEPLTGAADATVQSQPLLESQPLPPPPQSLLQSLVSFASSLTEKKPDLSLPLPSTTVSSMTAANVATRITDTSSLSVAEPLSNVTAKSEIAFPATDDLAQFKAITAEFPPIDAIADPESPLLIDDISPGTPDSPSTPPPPPPPPLAFDAVEIVSIQLPPAFIPQPTSFAALITPALELQRSQVPSNDLIFPLHEVKTVEREVEENVKNQWKEQPSINQPQVRSTLNTNVHIDESLSSPSTPQPSQQRQQQHFVHNHRLGPDGYAHEEKVDDTSASRSNNHTPPRSRRRYSEAYEYAYEEDTSQQQQFVDETIPLTARRQRDHDSEEVASAQSFDFLAIRRDDIEGESEQLPPTARRRASQQQLPSSHVYSYSISTLAPDSEYERERTPRRQRQGETDQQLEHVGTSGKRSRSRSSSLSRTLRPTTSASSQSVRNRRSRSGSVDFASTRERDYNDNGTTSARSHASTIPFLPSYSSYVFSSSSQSPSFISPYHRLYSEASLRRFHLEQLKEQQTREIHDSMKQVKMSEKSRKMMQEQLNQQYDSHIPISAVVSERLYKLGLRSLQTRQQAYESHLLELAAKEDELLKQECTFQPDLTSSSSASQGKYTVAERWGRYNYERILDPFGVEWQKRKEVAKRARDAQLERQLMRDSNQKTFNPIINPHSLTLAAERSKREEQERKEWLEKIQHEIESGKSMEEVQKMMEEELEMMHGGVRNKMNKRPTTAPSPSVSGGSTPQITAPAFLPIGQYKTPAIVQWTYHTLREQHHNRQRQTSVRSSDAINETQQRMQGKWIVKKEEVGGGVEWIFSNPSSSSSPSIPQITLSSLRYKRSTSIFHVLDTSLKGVLNEECMKRVKLLHVADRDVVYALLRRMGEEILRQEDVDTTATTLRKNPSLPSPAATPTFSLRFTDFLHLYRFELGIFLAHGERLSYDMLSMNAGDLKELMLIPRKEVNRRDASMTQSSSTLHSTRRRSRSNSRLSRDFSPAPHTQSTAASPFLPIPTSTNPSTQQIQKQVEQHLRELQLLIQENQSTQQQRIVLDPPPIPSPFSTPRINPLSIHLISNSSSPSTSVRHLSPSSSATRSPVYSPKKSYVIWKGTELNQDEQDTRQQHA